MEYIFVEYSIDCAHYLPNVPEGHKCGKMHGHRYDIRLEICGEVDPISGWIVDYADVKQAMDSHIESLDHHTLNDIHGLENPTCENLVRWIRLIGFPGLHSIEVRETHRAGAGWRADEC